MTLTATQFHVNLNQVDVPQCMALCQKIISSEKGATNFYSFISNRIASHVVEKVMHMPDED